MTMSSSLSGQASVSVTPDDSQVYLVVVSVPEFFGSYQNYPYSVKISEGKKNLMKSKYIYSNLLNSSSPTIINF